MKTPRFLVAACIALALAFTFSCSSDDDSDPPPAPVQLSSSGGGSSSSDGAQVGIGCSIQDYSTVKIGEQLWMAENMNCEVDGSVCYDDDPANCVDYGRLYTWEAAMSVCPSGWHLPSDDDWDELYAAAEEGACSDGNCPTAGKHLKAKTGWEDCGPSGGSSYSCEDTHGFSALPGGNGFSDGDFDGTGYDGAGYNGLWWSSSESEDASDSAYSRYMSFNYEGAIRLTDDKSGLFSVRCVQD